MRHRTGDQLAVLSLQWREHRLCSLLIASQPATVWHIPLGRPVVPAEKRTMCGSSADTETSGSLDEACSMLRSYSADRPPPSPWTSTVRRVGAS